jgi:homoserine/homoserine lactone efflux protein
MTADTWTLFLAVAAAAVLSPGPAMLAILGQALQHGSMATFPVVVGNVVGVVLLMAASVLGLAALLGAVPHGLSALRWAGVAYLAWLGLRALRTPRVDDSSVAATSDAPAQQSAGVRRGVLIALSNPKAMLFFGAVLPQFVDPGRPAAPQFALLAATFAGMEFVVTGGVALSAQVLAPALRRPAAARWVNQAGGAVMLAAAALLAFAPA